jgi:folate-dependent phosphoribosylglycinamide formyltransferase PurN
VGLQRNLLVMPYAANAQGLEWVAKNHIKPAVVHMSIEGGFSSLVNKAIDQLIKTRHVHVVVSAGGSASMLCASVINLQDS